MLHCVLGATLEPMMNIQVRFWQITVDRIFTADGGYWGVIADSAMPIHCELLELAPRLANSPLVPHPRSPATVRHQSRAYYVKFVTAPAIIDIN